MNSTFVLRKYANSTLTSEHLASEALAPNSWHVKMTPGKQKKELSNQQSLNRKKRILNKATSQPTPHKTRCDLQNLSFKAYKLNLMKMHLMYKS